MILCFFKTGQLEKLFTLSFLVSIFWIKATFAAVDCNKAMAMAIASESSHAEIPTRLVPVFMPQFTYIPSATGGVPRILSGLVRLAPDGHFSNQRNIHIIEAVDRSPSMNHPAGRSLRRAVISEAMLASQSGLPESARVSLIEWGGKAKLVVFRLADGKHETDLDPTNGILIEAIKRHATQDAQVDATHIAQALLVARAHLRTSRIEGRPQAVLLLTDGDAQDRDLALAEAEQVRKEGVSVVIVAVGSDADPEFLRTIAGIDGANRNSNSAGNRVHYVDPANPQATAAVFSRALRNLGNPALDNVQVTIIPRGPSYVAGDNLLWFDQTGNFQGWTRRDAGLSPMNRTVPPGGMPTVDSTQLLTFDQEGNPQGWTLLGVDQVLPQVVPIAFPHDGIARISLGTVPFAGGGLSVQFQAPLTHGAGTYAAADVEVTYVDRYGRPGSYSYVIPAVFGSRGEMMANQRENLSIASLRILGDLSQRFLRMPSDLNSWRGAEVKQLVKDFEIILQRDGLRRPGLTPGSPEQLLPLYQEWQSILESLRRETTGVSQGTYNRLRELVENPRSLYDSPRLVRSAR